MAKPTLILYAVRLGFVDPGEDREKCPIVVQLMVFVGQEDLHEFPNSLASTLVDTLGDIIREAMSCIACARAVDTSSIIVHPRRG